jgi:hypothetical protein
VAPAIPPTNLPVADIRLQKSLRHLDGRSQRSLRTSEVPKNFGTSSPDGRHNTVRSPAEICLGTRPSQADAAKPTNKAPTIPGTVWSRDMVNPADRACGEPVRPARAWRRLCHIFVRAQRESFLPLYVAPLGGEHHDAPVPPGWIAAYLLANSVAVTTRDHESTKSGVTIRADVPSAPGHYGAAL